MSILTSPFVISLVLAGVVLRIVISTLSQRHFKAFASSHGCGPVSRATDQAWPWGLDRLYAVLTARKRGKDPMDDYFTPPLFERPTLERAMLGGKTIIETIEPANVQAILATKFDDWEIGEGRHRAFRAVQGSNIFTSDGAEWRHRRAMFRPQFSRELINDLKATERATGVLFEAMGPTDAGGWTETVDIKPLLFRFVLDNATHFLFGESIESQKALMSGKSDKLTEEETSLGRVAGSNEYAEAFDLCSYYMVLRIRLQQFVFLGTSKAFRNAVATIKSVPDRIIDRALQSDNETKKGRKFDLLSSLLEQTRSKDEIRSQTLGILFAARDTTASLLTWSLLTLGQHPEVYQKLRSIILDKFQEQSGAGLDFAQLKDCRYLQYVLFETMRLYQLVPLNSRVAVRDTVLPTGGGPDGSKPVAVRKGQQVLWNIYAMHRRKDLWGDDALEYKPERWADPKRTRMLGGGWLYGPFSGGPRICLGQQYAMTEASYCLVRLVQRYDAIELEPGSAAAKHERVKKTIGVTLAPMELRVRMHEAAS